jgi:hypothetical protein
MRKRDILRAVGLVSAACVIPKIRAQSASAPCNPVSDAGIYAPGSTLADYIGNQTNSIDYAAPTAMQDLLNDTIRNANGSIYTGPVISAGTSSDTASSAPEADFELDGAQREDFPDVTSTQL